ncbi:MAG: hypothetical protein K9J77_12320 [Rhodoferax sp.]|nr:hypothetical protein [Rhodoferax sp.]
MTASFHIRFAAFSIALAMTAIVHGTMLAGFDKLAQEGVVAQKSAVVNVAALQKVTIAARKS